jgi:hypothetical protein
MVVFDRAATALSCPHCGSSDVERMGKVTGRNRYLCLEGHQFEVPRRPGVFARWREKTRKSK